MWNQILNKGEPQTDAHLLDCQYFINSCPELNDDNSVEYEDIFLKIEAQVRFYKHIFEIKTKLEQKDTQIENNEYNNIYYY